MIPTDSPDNRHEIRGQCSMCPTTEQVAFATDRTGFACWMCRKCRALEDLHSRPRQSQRIVDAAIAFVNAAHTLDANCVAGDHDDCPARPAEQELRRLVAAYQEPQP